MKNTFDLKKFLIENKLTNNSRLLREVSEFVEIANNLKKIKATAEAVLNNAERALGEEDKYAGIDRQGLKNPQAVEQQIEVVENILEELEDYAGDGWAADIENVAKEKNLAELQMMLKGLVEEVDKLEKALTGQPLQESALNEGWKNWALGAISALSVLGGGAAINQDNKQTALDNADRLEYYQNTLGTTMDKMSYSQLQSLGLQISQKTGKYATGLSGNETPQQLERLYASLAQDYVQGHPNEFSINPKDGLVHWNKVKESPYGEHTTIDDAQDDMSWNKKKY